MLRVRRPKLLAVLVRVGAEGDRGRQVSACEHGPNSRDAKRRQDSNKRPGVLTAVGLALTTFWGGPMPKTSPSGQFFGIVLFLSVSSS